LLPLHFWIIGGISLLICLVCLLFYQKNKKLLDEMWAVDTYQARDLRCMVSGGFDATVEVEGTVSCDEPAISLAARIPCCYYQTCVSREDRRTRTVTSGSGSSKRTRIETYYVWVEDLNKAVAKPFKVNDKTGFTLVDPAKASIDTECAYSEVIHQREPWFEPSVGFSDTGRYKIVESVFRPEGYVYVLGRATSTDSGEALIHYPDKGYMDPNKKFYIISRKSEKELGRSKQKRGRVLFWISMLTFLVALYCVLASFGLFPGLRD
jgi:hypothetical protein